MSNLLEKIKERLSDRNSPIRTVKGVAEAVGMSEAGFYRMVNRDLDTIKPGTMLALIKALEVDQYYFTSEYNKASEHTTTNTIVSKNDSIKEDFGQQVLDRILEELSMLREQIVVKDRQIEKLLDLLGKPEGAILSPLSADNRQFGELIEEYTQAGLRPFRRSPFFLPQLAAK